VKRTRNIVAVLLAAAAVIGFAVAAHGGATAAPQPAAKGAPAPAPAATAAPTAAPAPVPAADDPAEKARLALPVAEIDGVAIPLGEIETYLDRQNPAARAELADPAKRKELVDRLVNMEVLAKEAQRRGFDKDPEVASVRKNQLASLMHNKIADETPEVEPTDEQLRAYYTAHTDSYNKPEKVRARHILVADKAKAEKLLADMLAKAPSQYEFRRIAQEKSEDASTKARGGDLTFFARPAERGPEDPEVPEAVANAAFELKDNGEIAKKLVKSDAGYHIVMRTGHRDKMSLSFEDAKDRLSVLVRREARKNAIEAAIDALEQRFPIEMHEENLKDVVIDLSGGPTQGAAGSLEGALAPQNPKPVE
jgi:peptidyl-prolyl cis-trans isomerase C